MWAFSLASSTLREASHSSRDTVSGRFSVWALSGVVAALTATGVLLYLEQRWAQNVDLAFFKVNVWVGFAVLATVLAIRSGIGGS